MRKWIDLFEQKQTLFLRFGEIPANERSGIGARHWMMGPKDEEDGVSVYQTHWDEERQQWWVEDIGNYATFNELVYVASIEGGRKMYIVTGDVQDEEGTDGEPLLRNIKIIQQVESVKLIYAPGAFDGKDVDSKMSYNFSELLIYHPDGSIYKEDKGRIGEDDIDDLMGWPASINGWKGTVEGSPAVAFIERKEDSHNKPENEVATKIINDGFYKLSKPINGPLLVLKQPQRMKVYESLEEIYVGTPFTPKTEVIMTGLMDERFARRRPEMKVVSEQNGLKIWRGDSVVYLTDDQERPLAYVVGFEEPGIFTVNVSFVASDQRKRGYGEIMYRYLLDEGLMLVSDIEQSKRAKSLWERLAADPKYIMMLKADGEMKIIHDIRKAYQVGARQARLVIKKRA